MKTKLSLVLIIQILAIVFKSCKPDEKCVDGNYYKYLDDNNLNKISYKDFSVLTFISKKTKDTLVFTGQGYQYGSSNYISQGDCPQTTNLQYRSLTFSCNLNNDKIVITNLFVGPTTGGINFSYKNNNKNVSPASFGYPFYYDSLNIEGKYYHKVNSFTEINSTVDIGFLYTLNEGIIQLIYPPTNDTLNLIKLEL